MSRFCDGMQEEGIPYKGVLYIGLMIRQGMPYVIEYNVRFGDPECQVLLPLLKTDFLHIAELVCAGRLNTLSEINFNDRNL